VPSQPSKPSRPHKPRPAPASSGPVTRPQPGPTTEGGSPIEESLDEPPVKVPEKPPAGSEPAP
ncbi:MAG: hypothetical protein H0T79_19705, partial [Deltaproteobacteria bacterium]|nr:hypothetical protein [Deltaproteobacteria bacterium]